MLPSLEKFPSINSYPQSAIALLITDRTQADVDRAKEIVEAVKNKTATEEELTEYKAGLRGSYTYVDLNVIGQCLVYLKNRLETVGRSAIYPITPKTDWTASDLANTTALTDLNNMLACVAVIKSIWESTIPLPNTMNKLGFENANNIEKILVECEEIINKIKDSYYYSNDIYAGGNF